MITHRYRFNRKYIWFNHYIKERERDRQRREKNPLNTNHRATTSQWCAKAYVFRESLYYFIFFTSFSFYIFLVKKHVSFHATHKWKIFRAMDDCCVSYVPNGFLLYGTSFCRTIIIINFCFVKKKFLLLFCFRFVWFWKEKKWIYIKRAENNRKTTNVRLIGVIVQRAKKKPRWHS